MKNTKPAYDCPWAEHGLAFHNNGGALLCCHSRTFLKDEQGQPIKWHSHRIKDAIESPTRIEIQQALLKGEQHPNCKACWDEENVGGMSRRMSFVTDIDSAFNDIDYEVGYVDLKLGNQCNLACRTCNPWVSSMWYKDWWHVIEKPRGEITNYRDYISRHHADARMAYAEHNTDFWEDLHCVLEKSRYIDIYGAEPMLLDNLWSILHRLDQTGLTAQKKVHFNTNATVWNEQRVDLLGRFNAAYIDLSIDGIGHRFDYLRFGKTWNDVLVNLERYKNFAIGNPLHYVNICVTVSVINVFYLDEIWQWFQNNLNRPRPFHLHFNLAHLPWHINLKILPDYAKQQIHSKLSAFNDPEFQNAVLPVMSYMNSHDISHHDSDKYLVDFFRITKELDDRRGQDFKRYFPEMWQILQAV